MNWEQCRSVMERYAIKTDDMATEDAYFMATHMPFSQLEVYYSGRTSSPPKLMSEDEVFDNLIYNPENEHRMIIVRGDNGTGKSHLIRFLKAKLENSPATVFNRETEQLVFLRRLNNSVRGAFSQLLEQNVIKDPDVAQKLQRFVDSSDAKDEASFKTDILYAYIAAVRNDQSGETYKPVICRDIASYLSDSRVSEHLLREGGAISRCYNVITAPSNQVLKDTTIFTEDDFNVSKIIRAVIKQGDPQASDFASTIKGDDYEITRLINYLNRFTREVVQRCADISSESTKTVFVQLRRDLKKQGKNLTFFIEDFTGFTGIDSELITVLSTENDGNYSDLCRVTSIIGITNAYYDQFRDNFTDRVTHQISVTDRSYGTDDFIVQMAGRYINAIFCEPEELRKWNEAGADLAYLPISNFEAPCSWETVSLAGKQVSLYPFNSHALLSLYESLPFKSPRMFLKDVIRAQLKEYFDGKIYGDGWYFPMNPGNIQMSRDPHSSAIDRLEMFSSEEKNRLKSVFALWGNGSAAGIKESDGTIYFGGLNKCFLNDIGLEAFSGIGDIVVHSAEEIVSTAGDGPAAVTAPQKTENVATEPVKKKAAVDRATSDYQKYKSDITAWYTKNESLKYDADYRTWLRSLIRGDANQSGAINWQDIGVPAYIAEERLADLGCYYIDAQSATTSVDKAIVYMDRSAESRDALLALNEYKYAGGWDFDGAVYYQQRLITWLERRKNQIIEKVIATKSCEPQLPVLEWCLAIQYLRARIMGQKVDTSSVEATIADLLTPFEKNDKVIRESSKWNDVIQKILFRKADYDSALTLLRRAATTTMGAIHFSVDDKAKSCYRTDELIAAVEKLIAVDWDIEAELPEKIPTKHLLYNPASLLKDLYPAVRKAMAEEAKQVAEVINKLSDYIGELNETNMIAALSAVQELFAAFTGSVSISAELQARFDKAPIETTKEILNHVRILKSADSVPAVKQLTIYSGNSLHELYEFLRDVQKISHKAEIEEQNAIKDTKKVGGIVGLDEMSDAACAALNALCEQLENMEVYQNVAD